MELKQTGIRIPEDLLDDIKKLAELDMRTISATITIGMRAYVESRKEEIKPSTMLDTSSAKRARQGYRGK